MGNWAVVKTEINDDLIRTDCYYNRYKFHSGIIIYSGDLRSAAKYIIDNKDDIGYDEDGQWVQPEEIAGSNKWMQEHINIGIQ